MDIGSYYGGLQIILKKYFKKTNFFLVDFNHQLCRSYVYLKSIYPDSTHILPKDLKKNYEGIDNAFFYVPVSKLRNIENLKFDLVTNFFSFGEMTRESLNYYLNSKIIENAKSLYLVNRIVSSPYFEPTYTNDINIYEKKLVKLGVAEIGNEIKPGEIFPIEANLDYLNGIDFQKGCFIGQEVCSRMYRKGKVKKRIVSFKSNDNFTNNDELVYNDRTIGTVIKKIED